MGRPDANKLQDIVLSGSLILNEHCILENKSNDVVELMPCDGSMCYVNGKKVESKTILKSGDRVIFGKSHVFRFINPEQVRKEKNTNNLFSISSTSQLSAVDTNSNNNNNNNGGE